MSYVINYRPLSVFDTNEPQIIAIVQLEEGPRMLTNILGVAPHPDQLPLGMKLKVDYVARGDQWLPVFRPLQQGVAQ